MRMFIIGGVIATVAVAAACSARTHVLEPAGGVQGMTRVTSTSENEYKPQLAPDGSVVLFDARRGRDWTIVGVDPTSGARRTVFTSGNSAAAEVSWDPEGAYFVYTSDAPGVWSLVRSLSRSPNAAVAILLGGEVAPAISDPQISPDGRRVAFSTFMRDRWQLAVADIDGSNFTLLTEGIAPAWSPDGSTLAFARRVDRRLQLFTISSDDGSDLTQLTSGDTHNLQPAWSPDGRHIVFTSDRAERRRARVRFTERRRSIEGRFNLFLVRPDGTGVIQLTNGTGIARDPMWGSDGWIYFSSNQAGRYDIWRLRPPVGIDAGG